MKACSQHMRSICGDCLDKRKGDNYEVRLGLNSKNQIFLNLNIRIRVHIDFCNLRFIKLIIIFIDHCR